MKTRVGVLMGGYSSEFEISHKSGMAVYEALSQREEYDVFPIHITKESWKVIAPDSELEIDKNDFSVEIAGEKLQFDVLFNAIHGTPGEDGLLQGYLEMMGIPQTASHHFESALTFNKAETSSLLSHFGVTIPKSYYSAKGETVDPKEVIDSLGLPVFVKPNRAGSSFGVSKVDTMDQLIPAVEKAWEEDFQVVIESGIIGTELACGVVRLEGEIKILGLTEVVTDRDFFDFEAKYSGKSQEITPARIPDAIADKIKSETRFIYESLNLAGIARVDYILSNEDQKPYFIEVNSVPGMGGESIVPKQIAYNQWEPSEFYHRVLQQTLSDAKSK
ncbi:MAG: D-alanine--D-alanine ligase [Schleiferiaceae bacterium]